MTLEASPPCFTTGDTAVLEAKVGTFVDDVVCDLDSTSGTCPVPTVTPTPFSSGPYTDNRDGTVTDSATRLQWEKKTGTVDFNFVGCSTSACPDLQDVNTLCYWCLHADQDGTCGAGGSPEGDAFTDFLAKLNAGGGFAGHTDWHLPTLAELQSIRDCAYGNPCLNPTFGPTYGHQYWSATTPDVVPEHRVDR